MTTADPQVERIARKICEHEKLHFIEGVGAGAFKETFYVATTAGEPRALKVFRSGFNERTEREIEAMQRCQHANIGRFLSLHDFASDGQTVLYSLEEFLGGGSLASRIKVKLLTIEECRAIGRQLINALSHIAGLGLVHRDIKPDNIMFRDDRRTPVIVDFGLVRDLSASSVTASWVIRGPGTPYFASPEQLNNEKHVIDWRCDQFGLGVTLAISTFGVHPYWAAGDTPETTVERVAMRGSPSVDFISRCGYEGLATLGRMIQPWPILRYRTASDLACGWGKESET